VLWLEGELLLDRSYADRWGVLEGLSLEGLCWVVRRFPGTDTQDLFDACVDQDVEGIVLKRVASRYRPGERTRHWRGMAKVPGWAAVHAQRRPPI